jgi:hypothetical protein
VLQHVPPADLQEFIGSICRLAHPDTNIVIWAMLSDSATQQASKLTWCHSVDGIISLVQSFGFDTEICECFEVLKMIRLQRSAHALNSP